LRKKESVVPLSLSLGQKKVLLITGPNAGGKTVALKTVGLLSLMVQCGLLIPAKSESHFPLFDEIFADIGDEQSIEKSLSSFSSHIQNLVDILNGVGPHSLSLLDELGRDTDPKEGAALGESILEALARKGGMVLATTHHTPLKAFVHQHPLMKNGSMEFDESTLNPTYHFRVGSPGRSYALEICHRMGMPQEVTRMASERVGKQASSLEGLIADLDRTIREERKKEGVLRGKEEEVSKLLAFYEERLKGAKEEAKRIREDALREAQDLLSQANRRVEHLVAELKRRGAERSAILKAKRELSQEREKVKVQLSPPAHCEEIKVGDLVWVGSVGAQGEVETILGRGRANVRVKGSNVIAPLSVLRRSERGEKGTTGLGVRYSLPSQVSLEIDLRGKNAEEAKERIDKYLDDAFLAGLDHVRLIHGKGTGALRRKITSYLKGHPMVKSIRMGDWNEGGSGATVVELKSSTEERP
jgi:DNA mismatch repair protein MutS2